VRALRAVARSVHSFLIGDTPGLFVAALLVVAAGYALAGVRVAAVIILPGIAAVAAVLSAAHGRTALSGATRAPWRRRRGSQGVRQDDA
jgi:hypothetical protein